MRTWLRYGVSAPNTIGINEVVHNNATADGATRARHAGNAGKTGNPIPCLKRGLESTVTTARSQVVPKDVREAVDAECRPTPFREAARGSRVDGRRPGCRWGGRGRRARVSVHRSRKDRHAPSRRGKVTVGALRSHSRTRRVRSSFDCSWHKNSDTVVVEQIMPRCHQPGCGKSFPEQHLPLKSSSRKIYTRPAYSLRGRLSRFWPDRSPRTVGIGTGVWRSCGSCESTEITVAYRYTTFNRSYH